MNIEIPSGINHTISEQVVYEKTAASYGSGLVEVYATPAMISLMERTCMTSVLPFLPEAYATVGTKVDIKHVKATPIGMKVSCSSELIEVDSNRLVFKVVARDEQDVIGMGIHERYIIDVNRFMSKIK
jgi:predicted thioesterase